MRYLLASLVALSTAFAISQIAVAESCDVLEPSSCPSAAPGPCDPPVGEPLSCDSSYQGRATGNTYWGKRSAMMCETGMTNVTVDSNASIWCEELRPCSGIFPSSSGFICAAVSGDSWTGFSGYNDFDTSNSESCYDCPF